MKATQLLSETGYLTPIYESSSHLAQIAISRLLGIFQRIHQGKIYISLTAATRFMRFTNPSSQQRIRLKSWRNANVNQFISQRLTRVSDMLS
jgi:hypothetical protein